MQLKHIPLLDDRVMIY